MWLRSLRTSFPVVALGNLVWEFAQLPLYTIWHEGTVGEIVFAAVHCTGGDILIFGSSFFVSLLIFGTNEWPKERFYLVATSTMLAGLGYTIFSEWLNTEIRGTWAYTEFMPALPIIGTGISPLLQWIVVPALTFWSVRPASSRGVGD